MKASRLPVSVAAVPLALALLLLPGCAGPRPASAPRAEPAPAAVPAFRALAESAFDAGDPASLSAFLLSADGAAATAEAYPDADEVALLAWEDTRYAEDGTYATTWAFATKILTPRGLESNRTFSFWNNDFYGSTTVLVAKVRSPDGTARDIDLAANLAEATDTSSLASNIHDPNDKTFTLALPGLGIGDTVAIAMRRVVRRPRCEGVYADYLTFESDHPILLQGVRIAGPASKPLRSRAFRDPGPVALVDAAATNEAAGTIAETWVAAGETPRYFAEPDMPPAYDCTARLLLSTAPDWESLSRWYARLCAPHLAATNQAMRAKVDELVAVAEGTKDEETMRAERKLDRIVVDRVEWEELSLEDAIAGLTALSREFDPDAGDGGSNTLSFVLSLPDGFDFTHRTVTVRARGAKLGDLLREVLSQTGLHSRTDSGRIVVGFRVREEGMAMKRFDVTPWLERAFSDWMAASGEAGSRTDAPESGRSSDTGDAWERFLAAKGIPWPEGSSVRFVPGANALFVTNFTENIACINHLLAVLRAKNGEWFSYEPDPEIEALLRRERRKKIVRALFDFVSREVRYMGAMAESEAPGYEPHDVSLTFDNRYGVCRDKAALLVAMLRMAGIDAWPVLINVGPRKDAEVPQPYFNHAIVAADSGDPDDPYLLMDPTSETTRTLLPEYLCEKSYLVARDEGEGIRETAPQPVEDNLLKAETVFTLQDDASAEASTTIFFAGINDAAYRGYFASIPRDGVREFLERALGGIPGAVLTGWTMVPAPEDLRRISDTPLFLQVDYAIAEAARATTPGGGRRAALLDLPSLPAGLAVASRLVGDLGLEKRRFPLVTDYPCGFEETVELRLPEGVSVAAAPDERFDRDGILFADAATNAPSGAPGRHRALKLFRSQYSPEAYASLRAAREAEERAGRVPLLLEGGRFAKAFAGREFGKGLPGILARAVEPAPTDDLYTEFSRTTVDASRAPEEWTVEATTRRRILTYAGQRKAGDLTFRWNPATTDFEVVDARVVAPDGTETPIDPKLDLFQGDQEWVADAPRYPAGKLATVSFPKLAPGMSVQWTTRRRAHDRDLFSLSQTLGSLGSFGELAVTVVGTNGLARALRIEEPFWKTIADRFPVETNRADGATTFLVRGGEPGSQIVSEPNMPPLRRLAPGLRGASQTASERARAIAARMWELSDPAVQTNAAALARSLAPTNATVREAFVAIRDWCAINLREAGPAYWDLPLSALSPADATLEARYGHEADLRILQLAMARALPETLRPSGPAGPMPDGSPAPDAGVRPGLSLRFYNADWDGLPAKRTDTGSEPASASLYDTIAVAISEPRHAGCVLWNDDYLFDGATQYAPALGSRNRGRMFLAVSGPDLYVSPWTETDGDPFHASDREPGYEAEDGTHSEYDISVREDGSARIRMSVRYSGTDFEFFRKRYEQILPEERRRDAQQRVAALSQSARLVGEVVSETPAEGPCVLRFEADVPDFAVRDGDRLVLRAPIADTVAPPMRERRFPFRRTAGHFDSRRCTVRPPAGWRVRADGIPPRAHVSKNDGFGAGYDLYAQRDEDGNLVLVSVLNLVRAEFAPELYPKFLRLSLGGRGSDAGTVILERAPAETAAP